MEKQISEMAQGIEIEAVAVVEYETLYQCARCPKQTAEPVKVGMRNYCPACALEMAHRRMEMAS